MKEKNIINEVKKMLIYLGYYNIDNRLMDNVYFGNITGLEVIDNVLHITCLRPGLLIGKRGMNIEYLESNLKQEFGFDRITLIEDKFWDNLYD